MTYWRLYYHFTWATKRRQPLITPQIEPLVYRLLVGKARELESIVYAINGMPDHIHIAASIPPRIALSEWVKRLKGSSSRLVNRDAGDFVLEWQPGYGVVSFGRKRLPMVIDYIHAQKRHHAQHSTLAYLEAAAGE